MIIPQPGVQRCIDLHLHTQKGHHEAVLPGVARQCIRGLAAHPELWRPVLGRHGILHGSSDLDCIPPVVHGLLSWLSPPVPQ